MKAIRRKDTGDDWKAYLKKLAAEAGLEDPNVADAEQRIVFHRGHANNLAGVVDVGGNALNTEVKQAQVGEIAREAIGRIGRPPEGVSGLRRGIRLADSHLAGVVDDRPTAVGVAWAGAQSGHAVRGVPKEGRVAGSQGIIRGPRDLTGLIDARCITIREARRRAQVGHTVDRVPEESPASGTADHLAGVVDVGRLGRVASIQRSQVNHVVVPPVQVAVLEPYALVRG